MRSIREKRLSQKRKWKSRLGLGLKRVHKFRLKSLGFNLQTIKILLKFDPRKQFDQCRYF